MKGRSYLLMKRSTNKNYFTAPLNFIGNENRKMKEEIQIFKFKINKLIKENAIFEYEAKLLKDHHKRGIITKM